MKSLCILLFIILLTVNSGPVFSQEAEKKIALTFEYVPFMKPMGFYRARELSNMILRHLEQEKIQAAGFVVQSKVEDDPSTYVILRARSRRAETPAYHSARPSGQLPVSTFSIPARR